MKRLRRVEQKKRTAFTLMEVLLVLAILGVIAAMVVPQLIGTQEKAMIETTRVSLKGIETALNLYHRENKGRFPVGGDEVLQQLTLRQDINGDGVLDGPYLTREDLTDPWDRPFHYQWPNRKVQDTTQAIKPAVWSDGPLQGDEKDDIRNWKIGV